MRNTDQPVSITISITLVIPRRWLAGIARTRTTTAEHAEARAVRTRLAGRQLRSSLARLHADGAAVAALSAAAAAAGTPGCRGAGVPGGGGRQGTEGQLSLLGRQACHTACRQGPYHAPNPHRTITILSATPICG